MKNLSLACFRLSLLLIVSPCSAQIFQNMAPWYGIAHSYNGIDGGGSTIHDWDKDGWDDFVLTNNGVCQFYRNTGDGFELITPFISEDYHVKQLSFVDFDNDGDPDIFITCHLQRFRLFENTGDLNFVEISFEAGLPALIVRHFGHAWTDYNRDGWLDLYVASYAVSQDAKNFMFRNNGNGTFTEVAEALGVDDGYEFTFQPVFSDFNNDGWPDLFLANDKLSPNKLYINNSGLSFTDVSSQSNLEIIIDSMSATVGDSNNDGYDEIYVTNNHTGNRFHVNNGDLTFEDQTAASGTATNLFCWGAQWLDGDNDGLRDLFVATDFAGNPGEDSRNKFFKNLGGNQFESLTSIPFTTANFRSFSPSVGDFNNDGYADLLLNNHSPDQSQLWINQQEGNHFVKIQLTGVVSNADAIGTLVTVQAGDLIQYHFTKCGESYLAQNSYTLVFGLGSEDSITSVNIQWPSGLIENYYDLEADTLYSLIEGQSFSLNIIGNQPEGNCHSQGSAYVTTAEGTAVSWNTGIVTDTLVVTQSGWYYAELEIISGLVITSDSVYITYQPEMFLEVNTSEPLCFGQMNGGAEVTLTGNTAGAIIEWSNDTEGLEMNEVSAGFYTVTATNQFGCEVSSSFEIAEPSPLLASAETLDASPPDQLGEVILSIEGGVLPYTIYWPGGQNQELMASFPPGNYGVWIADANGCMVYVSFQIGVVQGIEDHLFCDFQLFKPTENPCNPCYFEFCALPPESEVNIFEISGRLIETISLTETDARLKFEQVFNALASNVYLIKIESAVTNQTIKVVKTP